MEQIGRYQRSNVVADLRVIFESFCEVKLVYLFGSQARGAAGPMSDFDFAVYLDERDRKRMVEIQLALQDRLQRRLQTDRVQIVVLNLARSPELKYDIVSTGELLYEEEPFKLLVEPRILNEYFDFRHLLRRHGLTKE